MKRTEFLTQKRTNNKNSFEKTTVMNTSATSSLKVTVNGKKYLITGIQKETSCKGLLCAIAKVTSKNDYQQKSSTFNSRNSDNLLECFKSDRELAGDLNSLTILNTLSCDAKIIAKETVTVHQEIIIDESTIKANKTIQSSSSKYKETKSKKSKHRSSHGNNSKETQTYQKEKKSKKNKKYFHKQLEEYKEPEQPLYIYKGRTKHRSADDSDIDTFYHNNFQSKVKHRKYYDDSDVDVYRTLEQIAVDQRKKIHRMQAQTKRKSLWMKELSQNSQIYYIDKVDAESNKCKPEDKNNNITTDVHSSKDDGNDSGLLSLEYDSSESQEIQPTTTSKSESFGINQLHNKRHQENNNDTDRSQITRDQIMKERQNLSIKENKTQLQCNDNNIEETLLEQNSECSNKITERDVSKNTNRSLKKIKKEVVIAESDDVVCKCDGYIDINDKKFEDANEEKGTETTENICETGNKNICNGSITITKLKYPENYQNESNVVDDNQMSSLSTINQIEHLNEGLTDDTINNHCLLPHSNQTEGKEMLDKNRNILSESSCNLHVSKMVAFNEALLKISTTTVANNKKQEKKKFKKSDISEPVLLSPRSLKKRQSLKKVEAVLGKQAADVFKKEILKSKPLPLDGKRNERYNQDQCNELRGKKEKENYQEKRFKEVRKPKTEKHSKTCKTSSRPYEVHEKNPTSFNIIQHSENTSTTKTVTSLISEKTVTQAINKNDSEFSGDITKEVNNKDIDTEQNSIKNEALSNILQDGSQEMTSEISGIIIKKHIENSYKLEVEILSKKLESERAVTIETNELVKSIKEEDDSNNNTENRKFPSTKPEKNSSVYKHKEVIETNLGTICMGTSMTEPKTTMLEQHENIGKTYNESKHVQTQSIFAMRNIIKQENHSLKSSDDQKTSSGNSELFHITTFEKKQTLHEDILQKSRTLLIDNYLQEKEALDKLLEKLSEYNNMLYELTEELEILERDDDELEHEEVKIFKEIEHMKSRLRSVADLTTYQRKEMIENLELLDSIDLEMKTQKANFDNLRSGLWMTSSQSAPRPLIKNAKSKRKGFNGNAKPSSSFV